MKNEMPALNFEWKPFIKIIDNCGLRSIENFLKEIPKDYKLLYALALSVAKWHPNRKYQGHEPIYSNHVRSCGLCVYDIFYNRAILNKDVCKKCILKIKTKKLCGDNKSLFVIWYDKPTKENANNMFKVLYKLYAQEYRKAKVTGLFTTKG